MNIASYHELFDQSKCPILIFASGNDTKYRYGPRVGSKWQDMNQDKVDFHKQKINKEQGQYPAILTKQATCSCIKDSLCGFGEILLVSHSA